MVNGYVFFAGKPNTYYVWSVRSGQSGSFGNAAIWKTGQITSYAAGDDGDLEGGVEWPSPRFVDNDNQTVLDNLTGLMWTKDANAPGPSACFPGITKTWQAALDYISCLNNADYLGYNDWRLPNKKELFSLIDHSQYNPALPSVNPFANVRSASYWSSSTIAEAGSIWGRVWRILMDSGYVDYGYKSGDLSDVWPVRGGVVATSANGGGGEKPMAGFYWVADNATSYKVNFNAVGSVCPGGYACTYTWDFGDSGAGAGMTTNHTYSGIGPYTVTLTVSANGGTSSSKSQTVTPTGVNTPPIAGRTALSVIGMSVSFTDTTTDDGVLSAPCSDYYSYRSCASFTSQVTVSWGDGVVESKPYGSAFSHTYAHPGTYILRQTAQDAAGLESRVKDAAGNDTQITVPTTVNKYKISGTITITVNGSGPLANATVVLKKNGETLTSTTTDTGGAYSFTGLNGSTTYTVTATLNGYDWQTAAGTQSLSLPASVSVGSADVIQDFHAAKSPSTL